MFENTQIKDCKMDHRKYLLEYISVNKKGYVYVDASEYVHSFK